MEKVKFPSKQYDSNDVIFSDRAEKVIYCHFKDIVIRDENVGEIDKTLFFGGILVVFPKQTPPATGENTQQLKILFFERGQQNENF